MLVNILVGILAVIGGFVVLVVISLVVFYFMLVRRANRKVRLLIDRMEREGGRDVIDSDDYQEMDWPDDDVCIPPFTMELQPAEKLPWWDPALADKVTRKLQKADFKIVGDYVAASMDDSAKRFFLGEDGRIVAVLHQDPQMDEAYLEFYFEMVAGGRGGVGNPSSYTIALPAGAVGKYFEQSLTEGLRVVSKMLSEVRALVAAHPAKQMPPSEVVASFVQAYNDDMLAHIRKGGLTAKEIEEILIKRGEEPDEFMIGDIQTSWQQAIEEFLIDQSRRAAEQDDEGHDVLAVHDGSLAEYLADRMNDFLSNFLGQETDETESRLIELEQLLDRFPPREGIARFRPLLPQSVRFSLIEQLKLPVETDFYLLPEPK